jgi:hypothetical protein
MIFILKKICGENSSFHYRKKSQATWSRELFEKIQNKSPPFEEVMKLPQFLEDLGIFLTFFSLKSSHLTNRFYWFTKM